MSIESKNRTISFRLSVEEYAKFRQLCFEHGLPSVSEMARLAISLMLQQPERIPQEALEQRVTEIEGRLHLLATELKRLSSTSSHLLIR